MRGDKFVCAHVCMCVCSAL